MKFLYLVHHGIRMRDRTIILLILLLWASASLPGCRKDLSNTLTSQGPLRVVIYESGDLFYERSISPNSREFRELVKWAERNSDGWETSMITVKPGILVEGKDFSLVIRPECAAFIYEGGQFARRMPSEDYGPFARTAWRLLGFWALTELPGGAPYPRSRERRLSIHATGTKTASEDRTLHHLIPRSLLASECFQLGFSC